MNYKVIWSEEDKEFVGTCDKFPSLSYLAKTEEEALKGIEWLTENLPQGLDEDTVIDRGSFARYAKDEL